MVFIVACLFIGCGIGLRFKVLAVVPAAVLAIAFVYIRNAGGDAFWSVLVAVAVTVSLQIGYLIGLCIHYLVLSAPADPSRVNSLSGASPTRTGSVAATSDRV